MAISSRRADRRFVAGQAARPANVLVRTGRSWRFIYEGTINATHAHAGIYAQRGTRLVELMRELAGMRSPAAVGPARRVAAARTPTTVRSRAAADAGSSRASPHYLTPALRRGLLLGFGVADIARIEKAAPPLARASPASAARTSCAPAAAAARELPG